jgi:DNA modification methylase
VVTLMRGDCVELMRRLPVGSVDLVACDPPYGITACAWDRKLPRAPFWREIWRVAKPEAVVVMFAQQPFALELAIWSAKWLRYEWIWDKGAATGFLNAHRQPLRRHEQILVFCRRQPAYYPQGLRACRRRYREGSAGEVYGDVNRRGYFQRMTGFPQSILRFAREPKAAPAQKPVVLMEYLIRTYSHAGAVVLDPAMGTGSTGVAAVRTRRLFVGMEIDWERFAVAEGRIIGAGDGARAEAAA